jgi:hypothetical protein
MAPSKPVVAAAPARAPSSFGVVAWSISIITVGCVLNNLALEFIVRCGERASGRNSGSAGAERSLSRGYISHAGSCDLPLRARAPAHFSVVMRESDVPAVS